MRFEFKLLTSAMFGIVIGCTTLGVTNAHAIHVHATHTAPARTATPARTTTPKTTKPSVSRTTNTKARTGENTSKSQNTRNTTYRTFNQHKGYGKTRSFPVYRSDGLNFFQRMWLFSILNNHHSEGTLIVKDTHGKSHYVDVNENVYRKWRNRGSELVYKQGHVYQIKTNHRIA